MEIGKVLVTGGNGFLGSNVARELFRRGYEVKLMMRPSADTSVIPDVSCELYCGEGSGTKVALNSAYRLVKRFRIQEWYHRPRYRCLWKML
ncbi:NAD-dependent epimerase/dehydratase family protein [Pedobacter frigoris]|uniref:NAD-dependent epimerase/dehydratase family protein n=1 Tax=Pedobacter frigoris TaxID=2571272 RepID=A0A4U1CM03_9SPHI|nr:NAD-dependent epimerase/dehydratase family protein [Pedobacter frigoris]TKC06250.1 NAD-dependent epimerase/dehydratase family protein [Pedobacter frigoris]